MYEGKNYVELDFDVVNWGYVGNIFMAEAGGRCYIRVVATCIVCVKLMMSDLCQFTEFCMKGNKRRSETNSMACEIERERTRQEGEEKNDILDYEVWTSLRNYPIYLLDPNWHPNFRSSLHPPQPLSLSAYSC